jgi:hypothetical protein
MLSLQYSNELLKTGPYLRTETPENKGKNTAPPFYIPFPTPKAGANIRGFF